MNDGMYHRIVPLIIKVAQTFGSALKRPKSFASPAIGSARYALPAIALSSCLIVLPYAHAVEKGPLKLDAAVHALQISKLAAENGMHELSLRAFREALNGGPPQQMVSAAVNSPGADSQSASRIRTYNQNNMFAPSGIVTGPFLNFPVPSSESGYVYEHVKNVHSMVEQLQSELDFLWQQKQFDPVGVYDAMVEVVLPESLPNAIFLYSHAVQQDHEWLVSGRSIGGRLIEWADRAGRLTDLTDRLAKRLSLTSQPFSMLIFQTQISLFTQDTAAIQKDLTALQRFAGNGFPAEYNEQVLAVSLQAMRSGVPIEQALRVFDAATDQIVSAAVLDKSAKMDAGQVEPASTLLLASAVVNLQTGNTQGGRMRLQKYLDLNESKSQRYSGKFGSQLRQFQLQNAAGVFLKSGDATESMRYMEMAAQHVPYGNSASATGTTQQLIRYLSRLPVKERYQQLRRLCLPSKEGSEVSLLSTFIPQHKLPPEFAALGRTSEETDLTSVSKIEDSQLVSTGLMFVDAAKELGELDSVIAELEALHKAENSNAGTLLALVYCRSGQSLRAVPLIETQIEQIGYDIRTKQKTRDSYTDLMLCMIAVQHKDTQDAGGRLAQEIADYNASATVPLIAEAVNRFRCAAEVGHDEFMKLPQPDLWSKGSSVSVAALDDGAGAAVWSVHDDVITHISGAGRDSLYLPFPLTGDFEFVVESTSEPHKVAAIGYGGLQIETSSGNDNVTVQAVGGQYPQNTSGISVRKDTLNETRLQIRQNSLSVIVNGQPTYQDVTSAAQASPWLFLAARSDQQPAWRFPSIVGDPVIPERIELSSHPRLRGWTTVCFGETRGQPWNMEYEAATSDNDNQHWIWHDGIISGRHYATRGSASQSLQRYVSDTLLQDTLPNVLQYERPMQSGESIAWEFQYQSDVANVAPVIGRTAFLMESDGLRLRYLVSRGNWHELTQDNSVDAKSDVGNLSQLPLKSGWNQAELTLRQQRLVVTLNGHVIYDGQIEEQSERQFGFYHDSRKHRANIRNVVLTGDWPKQLPEAYRKRLTQSSATSSRVQSAVLQDIIGKDTWIKNPLTTVRHAELLPPQQRYKYLFDWVLPSSGHAEFRMCAAAQVATPLSAVNLQEQLEKSAAGGSYVVSPILCLVDVAQQLNRLPELAIAAREAPANSDADMRISLGLLALIAIAQNDLPAADEFMRQSAGQLQLRWLTRLVTDSTQHDQLRWIDVIVASRALPHAVLRESAKKILEFDNKSVSAVSLHLRSLESQLERLMEAEGTVYKFPAGWHTVQHSSAETHGQGLPDAIWTQSPDGAIRHLSGHDNDHLFLDVPVTGNFSIECEITAVGDEAIQVGYNALALSFTSESTRQVFTNPFGRKPRRHWQTSDLKIGAWVKCRLEVNERKLTMFTEDRKLYETEILETPDPWVFVRCPAPNNGAIRNVKLTGDFRIPRSIALDTSAYLNGWSPHYYGESVGSGKPWQAVDGIIQAKQHSSSGHAVESLLQYHRPLLEDGAIRYQFFYRKGDQMVHPALGRLAFLLDESDGVVLHQLTDERYDFSGLTADNRLLEPEYIVQKEVPLRNDAWNEMAVSMQGDEVTLTLNDVAIYRRPLPKHNSRIFGLFHFKNQSAVQVTAPTWTGDWAIQVPSTVRPKK